MRSLRRHRAGVRRRARARSRHRFTGRGRRRGDGSGGGAGRRLRAPREVGIPGEPRGREVLLPRRPRRRRHGRDQRSKIRPRPRFRPRSRPDRGSSPTRSAARRASCSTRAMSPGWTIPSPRSGAASWPSTPGFDLKGTTAASGRADVHGRGAARTRLGRDPFRNGGGAVIAPSRAWALVALAAGRRLPPSAGAGGRCRVAGPRRGPALRGEAVPLGGSPAHVRRDPWIAGRDGRTRPRGAAPDAAGPPVGGGVRGRRRRGLPRGIARARRPADVGADPVDRRRRSRGPGRVHAHARRRPAGRSIASSATADAGSAWGRS